MCLFGEDIQVPGLLKLQIKSSTIKSNEDIILFPTAAKLSNSGRNWIVPIHGWIFDHKRDGIPKTFFVMQISRISGVKPDSVEAEIFKDRIHWFIVDNEPDKKITIQFGHQFVTLKESGKNGHFYGVIKFPAKKVSKLKNQDSILKFTINSNDPREFTGLVHCIPPHGITVISDIDDTVKISNVIDKKELMRNTFFKDFTPAPGMSKLYRKWKKHGVFFHYVSSSPWQLFHDIQVFMKDYGFPDAIFHMKTIRLKDTSLFKIFEDPVESKRILVEGILNNYPKHKFILVGDSGEKDPEIYGLVTRKYPDLIMGIAIRDITGESRESKRYQDAFRKISDSKWKIFKNPEELDFFKIKE